jgi:SAM-dependent methyltransferase
MEVLNQGNQIDEGILHCANCGLDFPIINKIPILWNDFTNYLSSRPILGGELFIAAKNNKMKSFVKNALSKIHKNSNSVAVIEKRWAGIYKTNKNSRFYSKIKRMVNSTHYGIALEHGCSIGHMTGHLAKNSDVAFGIDKSFYAISEAKKNKSQNLDFFVADSLEHPFGKTKFDLVLALNLFELIEPKPLLKVLAGQVKKGGVLALSDPYDFERGAKSVKEPIYEKSLRKDLARRGFTLSNNTRKPSFVPWNLKLNERASLNYLVDLVFATKSRL